MATPKIVPRAAGEGALGDAAYGWGGAFVTNTTTSSATQGGKLVLAADDGAVMATGHRLGVVEFSGAEDTDSTLTVGAKIEALSAATWSASENGADLLFYTTSGNASLAEVMRIYSDTTNGVRIQNTTTSSATEGGKLVLSCDDGQAMADDHRLGVISFQGAEDDANTLTEGARIESICDAAWSGTENGASLVFRTTDANDTSSVTLTLDSDKLATFAGPVSVSGALTAANRKFAVTSGTDGDAHGDIVYFGGTTSMTTGAIYHYKSDGTWELADADAVATSDGLLGVALGAASDTNGMCLRGMVTIDHDPGAVGDVLYLSTTAGDCSASAPSGSGDVVRIIGYQVSHASQGNIWFNPDPTFTELS